MVTVWLLFGCSMLQLLHLTNLFIPKSFGLMDFGHFIEIESPLDGDKRLLDHEIIISAVMWMVKNSCTTDDRKPNHRFQLVQDFATIHSIMAFSAKMWRQLHSSSTQASGHVAVLEGRKSSSKSVAGRHRVGMCQKLAAVWTISSRRSWFPKKHPSTSALNSRGFYKLSWTMMNPCKMGWWRHQWGELTLHNQQRPASDTWSTWSTSVHSTPLEWNACAERWGLRNCCDTWVPQGPSSFAKLGNVTILVIDGNSVWYL